MTLKPLRADPDKDPTIDVERHLFEVSKRQFVIGVDEVGRGALAGPVAVGAHVFSASSGAMPIGLRDSKLISEKRRGALIAPLTEWGSGAIGYAEPHEIDAYGITAMLGAAARRALLALHRSGIPVEDSVILLDGSHDWLTPALRRPVHVVTRVNADRTCASVAAASVRAKVARDTRMVDAHDETPYYSWDTNKGYGAKAHLAGIERHGLSPLHRRTWIKQPVG